MKTKKYIYALALFVAALGTAISCSDSEEQDEIEVKISLNEDLISLVLGTTGNLIATLDPPTANASGIRWESDDPSIASIATGVVTATGIGRTTVYARYGDNSDQCEVIVTDSYVATASVALNKRLMTIAIGHVETLQATVLPEEATDKTVRWNSSAPAVVSVDENGKVTGLSVGDAVITVTTNDGDFTDECRITVGPSVQLISPEADASVDLYAGGSDVVKFTWSCDVASVTDYTFEIGTTADFETPLYSLSLSTTELEIPQYELNELIGGGSPATVYWTVKPDPEGSALTTVRTLKLDPDDTEYLVLHNPDGAITMTTLEGSRYGYHIVNTNWAAIHTAEMSAPAGTGQKVLSLKFRSEEDVTLSIRFMRGPEYAKSLEDVTLGSSSTWTEKRLLLGSLPDNWGQAGDSLRIILPLESSYDFRVEALHFADMTEQDGLDAYKDIWTISSIFGVVNDNREIKPGQTEISLEVRQKEENQPGYADPGVNLTPQTAIIPPDATVLMFEYKNNSVAENCRFRVFIWGEHMNPISAAYGVTARFNLTETATEWTECTIDFSSVREQYGWGDRYGTWHLRWDPDDVIGFKIDVRNFRLVAK